MVGGIAAATGVATYVTSPEPSPFTNRIRKRLVDPGKCIRDDDHLGVTPIPETATNFRITVCKVQTHMFDSLPNFTQSFSRT